MPVYSLLLLPHDWLSECVRAPMHGLRPVGSGLTRYSLYREELLERVYEPGHGRRLVLLGDEKDLRQRLRLL